MRRSTGVLVLLLGLFLGFKVLRFLTLAYTFHDMYVFLQMATGWLDGRPFMYDNFWGDHQRIHNYYTMWLWAPLAYPFGAYGLFGVQTLLLLTAYSATNLRLANTPHLTPQARYALLGVVLLGPVSFWLNDHTSMAWHSELTYLPLGLLFALALTARGWGWPLLAGLGVVLVKEDGAVLAALIHLAYFALTQLRKHPERSLWPLLADGRLWVIGLGWGVVFVAGLGWLGYLNDFAEPRLRVALSVLAENVGTRTFWWRAGREWGSTLLLLLPGWGLLAVWSRPLRPAMGGRLLILYALGVAVLSALNFVQSAIYYTNPPLYLIAALTWPPRFVLPWTFTAAFLLFMLVLLPVSTAPRRAWLLLLGLFVVQLPILKVVRPDLPGVGEVKALVRGQVSPLKDRRFLDPDDLAKLQRLADCIPPRSNVMVFEYVLPYFHKHYNTWTDGVRNQVVDLAVIPIDGPLRQGPAVRKEFGMRKKLIMRRPYRIIRLRAYSVYVTAGYEPFLTSCIR